MILKEGGNVFKTEPDKQMITTRIPTKDVGPTIKFIEKIVGFEIDEQDRLGTTGKKNNPGGSFEQNSSGDIDLNTDLNKVSKSDIIAKLSNWCTKQGIAQEDIMNKGRSKQDGWIHDAGDQVHFRTPIQGSEGFVQTDFMFTTNPDYQRGAKRGGTEAYGGALRAMLLASVARGRGYKMSPKFGLVDPNKGDEVVADDWNKIAEILLGPGATEKDTHTVESMIARLRKDPNYEELIAPFEFQLEKAGKKLPESKNALRSGIDLAEFKVFSKTDKKIGNAVANVARPVVRTGGDFLKSIGAGFQAGKAAGDGIGAMKQAYGAAGGPKTSLGQLSGKVKDMVGKAAKFWKLDTPITGRSGVDAVDDKNKNKDDKNMTWFYSDKQGMVFWKKKNGTWANVDGKAVLNAQKGDAAYKKADLKSGAPVPESIKQPTTILNEAARIDHIEDLIFFERSIGAVRALEALKRLEKGVEDVTVKWDGSPALVFGRNENGEFVFTDKSGFVKSGGVERATDAGDLEQHLLNRSGGKNRKDPKRIAFAAKMKDVFADYEKAVPKDYRGYFKGDLLYYTTPPVEDGHFVFTPNIVEYRVDVNSDIGKRIARSKTAVVIHRQMDEEGNESALRDPNIFTGNTVFVVPPVYVDKSPPVDNVNIQRLAKIIQKDSKDIDTLLDPATLKQRKMTDFGKILYKYTNSKVDTGLDNLGRDFLKWVDNSTLSGRKKQNIIEYVKLHMNAFTSLWEVVNGIMKVKDQVIKDIDSQGAAVKAKLKPTGVAGGEGYVIAHPDGDLKLVNRSEFTAANRAVER